MDISTLQSQIKGRILTPESYGYDKSLIRWAVNAEKKAAIVVYVTSAQDVSATVPLLYVLISRFCLPKNITFLSW
jgi:hypothetical protein